MKSPIIRLIIATLVVSASGVFSQESRPATNAPVRRGQTPPVVSPELLPDGGVTFRYRAPKATEVKGSTIVPLKMYFKNGYAKVLIGVAKGKAEHDKRQTIAERESKRDMDRAMSRRR